jgi:hypothetical protein
MSASEQRNTNQTISGPVGAIDQYVGPKEPETVGEFHRDVWKPFMTVLQRLLGSLFANDSALSVMSAPGDVKLTLRQGNPDTSGFKALDGSAMSRAEFPQLQAAIGDAPADDDAAASFTLPMSQPIPLYDLFLLTETRTGKVWMDGRPIYRKVISCGALPNNAETPASGVGSLPHGITDISDIVGVYGHASHVDGFWIPLPYPAIGADNQDIRVRADTTNVYIKTAYNWIAWNGWVVLEYTKSSDAPLALSQVTRTMTVLVKT